jgi:O-acetyl-ADP-ribose deacetylase (regulator of RNase III)
MTLQHTSRDIFQCDAEALVNPVNTVGVMGKGLALQFKNRYPEAFDAYVRACACGDLQPGRVWAFETHRAPGPRFIVHFPTKRHWREASRMDDIESGLVDLVRWVDENAVRSLAIPPLGAGLGGLLWSDVRPRIVEAFRSRPQVTTLILAPWEKTPAVRRGWA